jgi:hypothetical protein
LFPAFKGTAPTGRDSIAQGASPGMMSKRSQKPQRGEIRRGRDRPANRESRPVGADARDYVADGRREQNRHTFSLSIPGVSRLRFSTSGGA